MTVEVDIFLQTNFKDKSIREIDDSILEFKTVLHELFMESLAEVISIRNELQTNERILELCLTGS